MSTTTCRLAGVAIAFLLGLSSAGNAISAQPWPERSVRFIVPYGPGSGPDVAARAYADRLAIRWKRSVVVENLPGADGLVGVRSFSSTRDDHTILLSPAAPISVFPFTHRKLGYDPDRDFVAISTAVDTFGSIAVPASLNVASLSEFIDLARSQPGKLNWSTGGGAFALLLGGFSKYAGLHLVHVPYREQGLAVQDLAEGRIQIFASTLTALLPLARAGKIRILAVTNRQRAPAAPEIPTATETGYPELEFDGIIGFFGGRGMPETLRDRISAEVRAVALDAVLVERLSAVGQVARGSTADEFADAIEGQRRRMESIARFAAGVH